MREQFSQSKSSTKDKALPKLLFMGKFNMKDEQFLQGLQDGEFFESRDSSGRLVYSWTQLEQVESRGSLTTVSMAAKQELDKNQKQVEAGAFDSWRGGLFSRDKTKALHDAASSGSAPLALCDRETELGESLWKKAQEQLHDAKRAYEKLEKDVRKGLQDVGVDAKEDPLWTTLKKELAMSIMNEKRDVDHVLSWKELPDGSCLTGAKYDEFIQGSGNRAVKLEDQVAGIKGQLSARLA
ncbi:unnamed protein product, partial [Durusdinium trenchii]